MRRTWGTNDFLPGTRTLTLRSVITGDDGVRVEAEGQLSSRCPACGQRSTARHSRYWRTLHDLAAHGQSVTVRVQASRWRCRNRRCETVIFTERFPDVCRPHAR